MKQIAIIHGPLLDRLGTREPNIYGATTLDTLNTSLESVATAQQFTLTCEQHASEDQLCAALCRLAATHAAIILNPGAFTHTSVLLRDTIAQLTTPVIEVHISNLAARESFRHASLITPVCAGVVSGFGTDSYLIALHAAMQLVRNTAAHSTEISQREVRERES